LFHDEIKVKVRKGRDAKQDGVKEVEETIKVKAGEETYNMILKDIESCIGGEDGYSIFVTGHSLGGALATLMAYKMAGSERGLITKPVTCITFASPRAGSSGFRTAFEELEKVGLLRHLRLNIDRDLVPAIPSTFIPGRILKNVHGKQKGRFSWPLCKHVGVNIRFSEKKSKNWRVVHSSNRGAMTAMQNGPFMPIFVYTVVAWFSTRNPVYYHTLDVHMKGLELEENKEKLKNLTFDDLYRDETIVSKTFANDYEGNKKKLQEPGV